MSGISQFPYFLYLVISEADCVGQSFLNVAEQAILGGVDVIQLREKNCATTLYCKKAKLLKEITDKYNIPLIINDNLEVAMQVAAAGIHVGNNDLPPVQIRKRWTGVQNLVGYSIEYLDQLASENAKVSNYFGISPVFSTKTKADTVTEWGLEGIAKIRQLTEKPLIAIGNIQLSNARMIMDAGADCIAVVSAICSAEDPKKAAYELKNMILK